MRGNEVLGGKAGGPADAKRGGSEGIGVAEEGGGGRLAVIAGASGEFGRLRGAVGECQGESCADGEGIAGRTAEGDAQGMAAGEAEVAVGEGGAVVAGD